MGYTSNPLYQKSTLDAYTTIPQTVEADGYVDFDNVDTISGCAIKYVAGTPGIVIDRPGIYLLLLDATVAASGTATETATDSTTSTTSATTGTDLIVAIQNNGELMPGARTTVASTGADDKANVSMATLLKVRPSCCSIDNTARISVVNAGVPATYTDASITIVKLC